MTAVIVGQGPRSATICNDHALTIIAGPCVLENRGMAIDVAQELVQISDQLDVKIIFKASFDKANRTSGQSPRGVGLQAALPIFEEIKKLTSLPITTDVQECAQCAKVAPYIDLIQIPALLSRQTDLLIAAANTGLPVNIKKGPFMAPEDMLYAIEKLRTQKFRGAIITERGTSFGYNNLISDMRSLSILKDTSAPVIFDASHASQYPTALGSTSGGDRRYTPILARAAVAVGVAGVFIETHPNPKHAQSDSATQFPLNNLAQLIKQLISLDQLIKGSPEIALQ
ncbi:MAG: 3-deoxy-8-phosphooctulonate synthase [Methylocystis sp.]